MVHLQSCLASSSSHHSFRPTKARRVDPIFVGTSRDFSLSRLDSRNSFNIKGIAKGYIPLPLILEDTSRLKSFLEKKYDRPAHHGAIQSLLTRIVKEGHDSFLASKVEICRHRIPQLGFGLFAKQNFRKGHIIGFYTGEVSKGGGGPYAFSLGRFPPVQSWVIDAESQGNYTAFINDCGFKEGYNVDVTPFFDQDLDPHLVITTSRDIKKEEEFFLDYGRDFWPHINISPIQVIDPVAFPEGVEEVIETV